MEQRGSVKVAAISVGLLVVVFLLRALRPR